MERGVPADTADMPVSRPVLLALVGAVLAIALFFVTMGSRSATETSAPPVKQGATAGKAPQGKPSTKADKSRVSAAGARSAEAKAKAAPQADSKPKAAAATTVPADVTRALEQKRTVVLFFHQRGSADDAATAKAVDSVRGRRGVKVFSVPISRLAEYRGVTGGAGVSQAPAVVILAAPGKARLIEGFVDSETLAQEVTDAR